MGDFWEFFDRWEICNVLIVRFIMAKSSRNDFFKNGRFLYPAGGVAVYRGKRSGERTGGKWYVEAKPRNIVTFI